MATAVRVEVDRHVHEVAPAQRGRHDVQEQPAQRRRWARGALTHAAILIAFALLNVLRAPQLALHPATMVASNLIDPVYHIWSVATALHNVGVFAQGPWSLFDGNIFYPTPHAASYGQVAAGLLPLILPLRLLTANPAAIMNALVALSFVLSAYGAFVLGRVLTGSNAAGATAGLIYGFASTRAEHIGHLNLLCAEIWLVAAAVCMVLAWQRQTHRWWAAAGLFGGLTCVVSLYQPGYLAAPLLLVALLYRRAWTRRRLVGAGVAMAVVVCMTVPFVIPYLLLHPAAGAGFGAAPSTDLLSFLQVLSIYPVDGSLLPTTPLQILQPGHGYFSGFVAVFLAWVAWKRRHGRPWAAFALACAVVVLGPQLAVAGHTLPIPLPYSVLSAVVPHFSLLRDPTRAMTGVTLGLAVIAAYGMRDVLATLRSWRHQRVAATILVGLVALETWMFVPPVRLPAIPGGEYWLARQPLIHVVAELPIANARPLDWQRQVEIMYDSTVHWKRLVNGSSSVLPAGMPDRDDDLASYPSARAVRRLQQLRVDAVVLRVNWLPSRQVRAARAACHVGYQDADELVCLPPWGA